MGAVISKVNNILYTKLRGIFSGGTERSITMIGLDGAGKTTLLLYLQTGEVHQTVPTLGFNCENVNLGNMKFQVWDIGGQNSFMRFWHQYINDGSGIIYMVDCADPQRFGKSSEELWRILNILSSPRPLLVLANKIDLLREHERGEVIKNIRNEFNLEKYSGPSLIVPISVLQAGSMTSANDENGREIIDAFRWLNKELEKMPRAEVLRTETL
ncbi:ADP-ribosylation factor 1 [Encephalitozoon hellem]|nr:ADP-ribosylation factor 1 [Encephalitozoon hellem]